MNESFVRDYSSYSSVTFSFDIKTNSLTDFIDYVDLYQEAGGDLDMEAPVATGIDGVQLMTVYQAKGLEWPVVFVVGCTEGTLPIVYADRRILSGILLICLGGLLLILATPANRPR